MPNRFWGCDCCACSPTMTVGGSLGFARPGRFDSGLFSLCLGYSVISQEFLSCAQIGVQLVFANESLARLYVGEGNYLGDPVVISGYPRGVFVTDHWLLLSDGTGNFARAESRAVPLVFETQLIPAEATNRTVTRIDLNNGEFVWERRSLDPASADFLKFDQTVSPSMIGRGSGLQHCVGMLFGVGYNHFIFEGDPFDVTLQVTTLPDNFPCPDPDSPTVCLTYQGSCNTVDGWKIGGGWQGYEETAEVPCVAGDPAPAAGSVTGFLATGSSNPINPELSTPTRAGILFSNGVCSLTATFATDGECPDDVTELPPVSDFEDDSNFCNATLATLVPGADCGDDGTNCGSDPDCPTSWCKWQWDVDTQAWVLIESNCIGDAECPDPPDDPLEPDVTWVECNCCVTVTPMCDPFYTPCPGSTCIWTWSGGEWIRDVCSPDNTCECQGMPEEPGAFNGATEFGICCHA